MNIIPIVVMRALVDTPLHHIIPTGRYPPAALGVGYFPDMAPFAVGVVVLLAGLGDGVFAGVVGLGRVSQSRGAEEQDAHKDLPCSTHDYEIAAKKTKKEKENTPVP
jgi:hypothetical protein